MSNVNLRLDRRNTENLEPLSLIRSLSSIKKWGKKIYDYLINQEHELFLGFVKSVLKSHGLVSKIVKTYKTKNKPHKSFENKLDRQFEVSNKVQEMPCVVFDITEWTLQTEQRFIYVQH